ncbi:MAG TPA: DUF6025 family protein [Candidatus Limnocylindrales bacterium]
MSPAIRLGRRQSFLVESGLDSLSDGFDVNVGRLLDAIRRHSWLHPVRSGRIGNWTPIWSGASPWCHNRAAIADLRVARPVIGTASFTDDATHRPGWVYRAGTLQPLPLVVPAGINDWLDVRRDEPRFVPWTWAVVGGEPVNVAHLHAAPTRTQAPVALVVEAELLWRNVKQVSRWLANLWRHAPEGDVSWLFGRGVRRDGTATPIRVRRCKREIELSTDDGRHWRVQGDADDLTRLCLLPHRVVAEPAAASEALVRGAPEVVPLLSDRLTKAILGYLGVCGEFEEHNDYLFVEWAAPPRSKPGQRRAERITAALAEVNGLPPLRYVTLPMTPMLLMPSTAAPDDAAAIGLFLEALRARTSGSAADGSQASTPAAERAWAPAAERTWAPAAERTWASAAERARASAAERARAMERARAAYRETMPKVSAGFRARFGGGPPPAEQPGYSRTIELAEVRALTLGQAGLAVATLLDAWKTA